MSTIIRATDRNRGTQCVAFNFDDMSNQADGYLDQIRKEAEKIVAAARQEAETIRRRAEEEGRKAGFEAVEQIVGQKLATLMPAVQKVVADIGHAKQDWLTHWESSAVRVSAAIAERIIRRELAEKPEITLGLVREALELAAGNAKLEIRLNSEDHKLLGSQVEMLAKELASQAETEVLADADITPGGCRIETKFGTIDQQIETQLKRIEEELT